MAASELPQINLEAIIGLGSAILAIVVWLLRMESSVRNNREKQSEVARDIEKVDLRIEKLESRHDAVKNELTTMLIQIQSSLSNLEGRLHISNRDRDRERDYRKD